MTDRELAGCPFCGAAARLRIPQVTDGYAIHISCRCGAEMYGARSHFATGEQAIAAWNRRAPAGEDARPTIADLIDAKLAEGDKRDAARYRWLRDLPDGSPYECIGNMPGDRWDDEIDAAMEKERGT